MQPPQKQKQAVDSDSVERLGGESAVLARGDFGFVGVWQALHHHAAGIGEEPDLARMDAAQVLGDDRNMLGLQVLAHELGITGTDRIAGEALQYVGAAEHLGLDALAVRAALEHVVDQQFHRIAAVACGRAVAGVAFGQQEVVHAADLQHRVAQARGHAGAERSGQRGGVIHHQVLGWQQLGGDGLEACVLVAHHIVGTQ